MKERGILFTPENYAKCASGAKTQTRRIIRPDEWEITGPNGPNASTFDMYKLKPFRGWRGAFLRNGKGNVDRLCPFGTVGDRLYVKEGLEKGPHENVCWRRDGLAVHPIRDWEWQKDWLSPLHMPKWAARLWLEITGVRVERLHEISEADAAAEGVTATWPEEDEPRSSGGEFVRPYRLAFRVLWESNKIHKAGSWDKNPWVWVLEFKKA